MDCNMFKDNGTYLSIADRGPISAFDMSNATLKKPFFTYGNDIPTYSAWFLKSAKVSNVILILVFKQC